MSHVGTGRWAETTAVAQVRRRLPPSSQPPLAHTVPLDSQTSAATLDRCPGTIARLLHLLPREIVTLAVSHSAPLPGTTYTLAVAESRYPSPIAPALLTGAASRRFVVSLGQSLRRSYLRPSALLEAHTQSLRPLVQIHHAPPQSVVDQWRRRCSVFALSARAPQSTSALLQA